MRLYLAGPVTGHPDRNAPAFQAAAAGLTQARYAVWNPVAHVPPDATWPQAMRRCLRALLMCDGVALLDGWSASRGAQLEVQVAQAVGLPVDPWGVWVSRRLVDRREGTGMNQVSFLESRLRRCICGGACASHYDNDGVEAVLRERDALLGEVRRLREREATATGLITDALYSGAFDGARLVAFEQELEAWLDEDASPMLEAWLDDQERA